MKNDRSAKCENKCYAKCERKSFVQFDDQSDGQIWPIWSAWSGFFLGILGFRGVNISLKLLGSVMILRENAIFLIRVWVGLFGLR